MLVELALGAIVGGMTVQQGEEGGGGYERH